MQVAENTAPVRRPRVRPPRLGTVVVLAAVLMIVVMAVLSFSLDVGYMYTMDSQLQRSVDAAALAGAGQLIDGPEAAYAKAAEYLIRNPIGGGLVVALEDQDAIDYQVQKFIQEHSEELEIEIGHWNADAGKVEVTNHLPSTIGVTMEYRNNPLFFARALGIDTFNVKATSVAMYQPRDIVLVLDLSGSMNDDSEFAHRHRIGQDVVEANLMECWEDLGSPTYGSLPATPQWAVIHGVPQNDNKQIPHITIEYRYNEIFVTSTHDLDRVRIETTDGGKKTWKNLSGKTGTFSRNGNRIHEVWVESWNSSNTYGKNGEYFDLRSNKIDDVIKESFGLDHVAYPYNGSWNSYIDYCCDSNSNSSKAGYHYKFGGMNLMEYWLARRESFNQTDELWKVSAQPITQVKDAVDVFMDYIQEVDTNDRVGLSIYNASDGDGLIEEVLTGDFDRVVDTVRHRQAGHYHSYTNIGAGMQWAREHLDNEGRTGAFKMIVLMTDGKANWVNGRYDQSGARDYVLGEAQLAADRRYPIVTIALGVDADQSLMEEVAEITNGRFFRVEGAASVSDYTEDLLETFREIANNRPLKIVQ